MLESYQKNLENLKISDNSNGHLDNKLRYSAYLNCNPHSFTNLAFLHSSVLNDEFLKKVGHNSFLLCKFRHKFLRPPATFSSAHKDDKRRRNGMMSMDIGQAIGEIFDLSTQIIVKRLQKSYYICIFSIASQISYEFLHSWLTLYLLKCGFTSTSVSSSSLSGFQMHS